MRKVLIEWMRDREMEVVLSSGIRDLREGKVSNGGGLKRGERTTAALAASVSTIAIRKAW
jgi:hypothetical protein